MRYWWVNQNQTYRAEVRGSFMWSPKRNANGARNQFYENMRSVAPGDVIFSFCDTRIKAIGVVTGPAETGPKPDFGSAGVNWSEEGWFVSVDYCTLKRFSDSPCTAWARRGTSARTNAGGPMQAYSMDLRERALLDSDAGMKAADVAVKYRVSGSWVRLLKQRRRETGEVAPRVQRHGRRRMLEPHLHTLAALIAEQPDRTLAELKDALGTPASVATIWRAVAALDVTVKKNGPALRTRST